MRLYLVQHGQALFREQDPERSLSDEGVAQTQKIADFFKGKDLSVDIIWHSQKARAIQTAHILSNVISHQTIEERHDLNPMDSADMVAQELIGLNKDVMIVGHLPFLQKLASLLLTGRQGLDIISFRYSAVVCLEFQEEWKVLWFLTLDLV
ncbi:phosphohistidine phosphatase SixA [Thermoproteota archaeon]